jgi:4'-phosphopantetheinyl transferase
MELDDVQIYLVASSTPAPDDLTFAWSLLDENERAAAARFHQQRDRDNYVLAHGLLRAALARHTGIAATELRFGAGSHGRPELLPASGAGSGPRVRFNLSHTHGLVGCAITREADIGFDVEAISRPAPLEIVEDYFTPEEVASLQGLPPARRDGHFYTLWVLKEAYIKGRGLGLSLPLQSFQVAPGDDGSARISRTSTAPSAELDWSLRWWGFPEHLAGLAVREPAQVSGAHLSWVDSMATFYGS